MRFSITISTTLNPWLFFFFGNFTQVGIRLVKWQLKNTTRQTPCCGSRNQLHLYFFSFFNAICTNCYFHQNGHQFLYSSFTVHKSTGVSSLLPLDVEYHSNAPNLVFRILKKEAGYLSVSTSYTWYDRLSDVTQDCEHGPYNKSFLQNIYLFFDPT